MSAGPLKYFKHPILFSGASANVKSPLNIFACISFFGEIFGAVLHHRATFRT